MYKKLFIILISPIFLVSFFTSLVFAAPDKTAPISTFSINPASPNGENGWFVTKPQITISASDNLSGVKAINYRINNEPWVRTESFGGLNIIRNPSFESGYISDWTFIGPFLSIGYKSSLFYLTGTYSAGIISLSPFFDSYFENTDYIIATPNKTYSYSMYLRSITSFLDNGYVEIVSVANGKETIISKQENIDLKFNYKLVTGTFTTTSSANAHIFIRIGLRKPYLGHLSIEDVYVAPAGSGAPTLNFILDREGVNTLQFYSEDVAGNIENTKQVVIKIDTVSPAFSNFKVTDQDNIKKFASSVNVADATSGLLGSPVLFNYSVNGIDDGYFENYGSCTGNFLEDQFLNPTANFSDGSLNGTITTPKIDYCDANWVNCKKLNFYAKDIAGNISSHIICVNGPYITTNYGDVFGRSGISQMGIGAAYNIWGLAVSSSTIDDVSMFNDLKLSGYTDASYYLNPMYQYYLNKYDPLSTTITNINNTDGVYKIDGDYTLTNALTYINASQIVLIKGDLTIDANITSTNSVVVYLVNGNVTISNTSTNVDVGIISTNQIFTSGNYDLASKLTMNGFIYSRNLVFNRNTDRTLGASEIINFPIHYFFSDNLLSEHIFYWKDDRSED